MKKREHVAEIKSRQIRAYVRGKLAGFAERQAAREKVRKEGKPATRQERLFE